MTIFYRRDHFIATTIEWFHLLLDIANEDIIRSKLIGLNRNLFQQVISRANIEKQILEEKYNNTIY